MGNKLSWSKSAVGRVFTHRGVFMPEFKGMNKCMIENLYQTAQSRKYVIFAITTSQSLVFEIGFVMIFLFFKKNITKITRWVPFCQGFSHFSAFSYHFVLAKLATSSMRVNPSNTEATFIPSTWTRRFLKTI